MKRACVALLVIAALGCGDDSDPAPTPDAGGGADAGTSSVDGGGGGETDAATASGATHGCEDADFVDRTTGPEDGRMIMVPRGTNTFDYPCMTIRAGQAVMFMWMFSAHPLAPGVAPGHEGTGTEPSPIEAQSTGALYTPTFTAPGDYPFYCSTHYHSGMYGVVRVVP